MPEMYAMNEMQVLTGKPGIPGQSGWPRAPGMRGMLVISGMTGITEMP